MRSKRKQPHSEEYILLGSNARRISVRKWCSVFILNEQESQTENNSNMNILPITRQQEEGNNIHSGHLTHNMKEILPIYILFQK